MDPSAAFNAHRTGGVVGNLQNYMDMTGRTVHQVAACHYLDRLGPCRQFSVFMFVGVVWWV